MTGKKQVLVSFVKVGISAALITWLIVSAQKNDPETFTRMVSEPKHWDRLLLAFCAVMSAVVTTFVRWYFLVRALGLPFLLKDAFRLGFLGFFCNFFSLGAVGGDLFKAFFIAREHPERRAEAVATVVVDRVIGLYALFLVATAAILSTGLFDSGIEQIRLLCRAVFVCTGAGAAGIVMLIIPGITTGKVSRFLRSIPKVGGIVGKLIVAIRIYRRNPAILILTGVLSLGVHSLMALGIFLIAEGLPGATPGFGAHFVLVPLSLVTAALPLPAAGLGAFEAAMEFLYRKLPAVGVSVASGQGLLVALTYRMITILVAVIGAFYYFSARGDVAAALESAEKAEEAGLDLTGSESEAAASSVSCENEPLK